MKKLSLIGFLCASLCASAQEVPFWPVDSVGIPLPEASFVAPFDFPMWLSGNFGELRPNHFHGGLDIKTQGVVGKPVKAVAEGYVSRISVSPTGYGNALYVTHPNGYTSVYGHLDRFNAELARYVEDCQYDQESFAVQLYPDSTQFRYHAGEVIAYSGNTGSSGGPHLHLELRVTKTNELIDPMPFFCRKLKDTRAPRSASVMLYAAEGEGTINGQSGKHSFAWARSGRGLTHPVTAWGKIGVGIRANDYMDGTSNVYGVRSITLTVDGAEIFRSLVTRVSFDENRAINGWTDYDEYKRRRVWYAKSFLDPGNRLRLVWADAHRGWVDIDEERDYEFRYRLEDAFGNVSVYAFTVRGKRQAIPPASTDFTETLHWDRPNVVQRPGMQLVVPSGMLYKDLRIRVRVKADSAALSHTYQIHDRLVPLHTYSPLRIGLRRMPVDDPSKYYIAQKIGNRLGYIGGEYKDGWLEAQIRELGTFTVAVDTVSPTVTPLNRAAWGRTGKLDFRIKDAQSGIATYRGEVDGHFVLFEYSARHSLLTCRLSKARLRTRGWHTLKLTVTDRCGNTKTVVEKIKW